MTLTNFEPTTTFPREAEEALTVQKKKIKKFFSFFDRITLKDEDIWLEHKYSADDNGYFWDVVFSHKLQKKIDSYRYVLITTFIPEKFHQYLDIDEYPDLQIVHYYNEDGDTKECVVGSETIPGLNLVMDLNTARIFFKVRNYPH